MRSYCYKSSIDQAFLRDKYILNVWTIKVPVTFIFLEQIQEL